MKLKIFLYTILLLSTGVLTDDDEIMQCKPGEPFPWKFLGRSAGKINENKPSFTFPHHCFQKTIVTFEGYSSDGSEAIITFDSQDPVNTLCTDAVLIHNMYNYEVKARLFRGKSTFRFKIHKQRERDFIDKKGLIITPLCDSWINLLPDIFVTALSFINPSEHHPDVAAYLIARNMKIMNKATGRKIIERTDKTPMSMEWVKKNIRSGDVYCDNWESGVEILINMATGSECEHTGVFMWGIGDDEGQLYMVQSNGKNPGIVKIEIEHWYKDKVGHSVALNRLSEENSKKFDVEKAWAGINKNLGNPYGFETFLFSFLDTPEGNFPQLFDFESFSILFSLFGHVPLAQKFLDLLVSKGLNKRLGTEGLSYFEILDRITQKGMTLGELWAIPEKSDWKYQTGDNYSERYVCSAFATYVLQQGGIMPEEIAPQEFTPKDVFELAIFEEKPPAECQIEDPNRPFCMLYGDYGIDYSTYNSVKPYPHMNERCPTRSPYFFRPSGC